METPTPSEILNDPLVKLSEIDSKFKTLLTPELKSKFEKQENDDWLYQITTPEGCINVKDDGRWTEIDVYDSTEEAQGRRLIENSHFQFRRDKDGKVTGFMYETSMIRAFTNEYPSETVKKVRWGVGDDRNSPVGNFGVKEYGEADETTHIYQELDKVFGRINEALSQPAK